MTNLKKYISHKIWDKNLTTCKLVKKTLPLLIIRKIKQAAILSSYLTNKIQKMKHCNKKSQSSSNQSWSFKIYSGGNTQTTIGIGEIRYLALKMVKFWRNYLWCTFCFQSLAYFLFPEIRNYYILKLEKNH